MTAPAFPVIGYLADDPEQVAGLLRPLLPEGWELVALADADNPELARVDYLVLAAFPLTAADIARALRLKLVHKVGVGYDNVDVDALAARGIRLAVCPLGSDEAVAEHAVALALASLKAIPFLDHAIRARNWPKWQIRDRLRKVQGRTVGIVGLGRIGRHAATLFHGLGCEVIAYTRTPPISRNGVRLAASLDELFDQADIVSLHLPLTPATRHMIGRPLLDRLGPEGLLVNTARGAVVDQEALHAALAAGTLGAAALDVLEEEPPPAQLALLDLPNVIFTPHIGGGGLEVIADKLAFIVDNIARLHAGGTPLELIPLASAAQPRTA